MELHQVMGISLFGCAFLNLIFAVGIWSRGKTRSTFHLGWLAFFSTITSFTFGGVFLFDNKLFWARATWLTAFVPAAYISFIYHFSGEPDDFKPKPSFWYFLAAIISVLALTTPFVLKSVTDNYPFDLTVEEGFLRPVGRIYGIVAALVGLYYVVREYLRSEGFRKEQIKYFILGLVIYDIGSILLAGIIPLIYPEFIGTGVGFLTSVFLIGLTAYAIFKKQLFEIRIFLTEILVVIMGFILLVSLLLPGNLINKTFGLLLFLIFSLIGYLLIRATYQDIRGKEKAEQLAQNLEELSHSLEEKVKERTEDLESSYQELSLKTKELERKKAEVEKRTKELEKFYKLTVGREVKMKRLKKKVEELEGKS